MKYTLAILVVFVSVFGYFFWYHQDADLTLLFYEKFGREPCSVLGGKVVWITGASSGIGEYLAYELAQCGCKLVLSARRKHELEIVKDNCAVIAMKKFPSYDKDKDILVLQLDLIKTSTHGELTSQVMQRFGKVDILVNNAGVGQGFLVEESQLEVEKNILDINLFGTISLTKAVLPHMLKRQAGQIVVVSSVYGKYGIAKFASYSASKFGLQGYFDSLRMEISNRNITVLTVLPGPVLTNIVANCRTGVVKTGNIQVFKETSAYTGRDTRENATVLMTSERCGHLMMVAMANDLKETWPSTQEHLTYAYMAQYMPSFFQWYTSKVNITT